MEDYSNLDNLLGIAPADVVPFGPTKRLIDAYHWHSPQVGIVASYTVKDRDVLDHFGIYRGVDQIETMGQTSLSCATFLECVKRNTNPKAQDEKFLTLFSTLGRVIFHNSLAEGDTLISMAAIQQYKFRQITVNGRIYKAPQGMNLDHYFKDYSTEDFLSFQLSEDFTLVAEVFEICGRAIPKEKINIL